MDKSNIATIPPIDSLGDYDGSLNDLIKMLEENRNQYGGSSRIKFDAGHNNVEIKIFEK